MRMRAGWLNLVLLAVLGFAQTSFAYYLDNDRRFDVRVRAYSQLGILTESSETAGCPNAEQVTKAYAIKDRTQRLTRLGTLYKDCPPSYHAGDLGQHRNFYNPEFDANLSDFMRWTYADEFKFRFAWWGFYDGLYDYLNPAWNHRRRSLMAPFSQ